MAAGVWRSTGAGLVGLSPSTQQAVKKALTSGTVTTPRGLTELARGNETLMGSSGGGVAFPLVSPVGVVVRGERPTLRWRPLSGGATSYTVTLLDANLNAVATSPLLDTTEWTVPRALARGASYTWQVTAVKDGREIIAPAAPEARFKILEPTQAAQLRRLEAAYPTSHLARGVSYAQATTEVLKGKDHEHSQHILEGAHAGRFVRWNSGHRRHLECDAGERD